MTTSAAHMKLIVHVAETHISSTSFILPCHILGWSFILELSLLDV